MSQPATALEAAIYDAMTVDWPGEIAFYERLAKQAKANGGAVLEIACGTGRISLRMANLNVRVVGIDLSEDMLDIARQKSISIVNVGWVQSDMRRFDLGERFALVIIPANAFQFLLTPSDQMECLQCVKRHMMPGGRLVIHVRHQSLTWLGALTWLGTWLSRPGGAFKEGSRFNHPKTGHPIRTTRASRHEPSSQTTSVVTVCEEVGDDGQIVNRWEVGPLLQHCVFRFEMEHLLARAGFVVEGLYGDFMCQDFKDESSEMIWLAHI